MASVMDKIEALRSVGAEELIHQTSWSIRQPTHFRFCIWSFKVYKFGIDPALGEISKFSDISSKNLEV